MESWDDDNFEPNAPAVVLPANTNKWEGEDEDDDVKDNWEDEDEETKEDSKVENDVKKTKKKSIQEKIAEKERQKKEEKERRLKELEDDEKEMSPEERLRRQKESDLKLALETTFGGDKEPTTIDGLTLPNTKEEFESFAENLTNKLSPLAKNSEYINFIENLTRNLCAAMSSLDIKRVKNSLDNLYLEKQKIEKGDKTKKNKGKGKAKLKLEGDNELSQLSAYVNDYDDYDDFM